MSKHLVIMAGGIGSRFWPMSTTECPKLFLDITGCGRTMIQQTFDRFEGIIDMEHVWVVTSENFKHLVTKQLEGIQPQHILLEPCMRNTAPCIAYVSWKIQKEDPEAQIVVAPSDHLVLKVDKFKEAIARGFEFISQGNRILTLGMQPTRPEIGYGYIEQGEEKENGIFKLASFREKPNLPTAIGYLQKGTYTWNSGMFMWKVETIINELRLYAPQIAEVMDQISSSLFEENEQEVVNQYFPTCEKISIDYAVMERTQVAFVQPAEFGWSDLGTWGSLHAISSKDVHNNALIGNDIQMFESRNCVVHTTQEKKVVIQGLNGFIVAEKYDTLLICRMSEEQRIKQFAEESKQTVK